MLLELKKGILYGPVNSRRLGKSLGVNLMPWKYKLCSFNCIYCHFGWTDKHTRYINSNLDDLPKIDEVIKAIEEACKSDLEFNYITFSGNGEPTLYPNFLELVYEVRKIRNKLRGEAKIALLSNSTNLSSADVQRAISYIDYPMFKLDAGREDTFRIINYPSDGISFDSILGNLEKLGDRIIIQTILMDGEPNNVNLEELTCYYDCIVRIKPREVHIYSIDRPVPEKKIIRVNSEKLKEIAKVGEERTNISFKGFYVK